MSLDRQGGESESTKKEAGIAAAMPVARLVGRDSTLVRQAVERAVGEEERACKP